MASRHIITATRPAEIHGDNLAEEVKSATGLRSVDVTLLGTSVQVSIPGDRPAGELEELDRSVRQVVAAHKGQTPEQVAFNERRSETRATLSKLTDKVTAGGSLTDDEVRLVVTALLLERSVTGPRR